MLVYHAGPCGHAACKIHPYRSLLREAAANSPGGVLCLLLRSPPKQASWWWRGDPQSSTAGNGPSPPSSLAQTRASGVRGVPRDGLIRSQRASSTSRADAEVARPTFVEDDAAHAVDALGGGRSLSIVHEATSKDVPGESQAFFDGALQWVARRPMVTGFARPSSLAA